MKVPVEAVRALKRDVRDVAHLMSIAEASGFPCSREKFERYWKGDMSDIVELESFLLLMGYKVVLVKTEL